MGKKKSEEQSGVSEQVLGEMMADLEQSAARDTGKKLVDYSLLKAGKQLYEEYLKSREIPFTVDHAMEDLFKVIQLAFIKPESGETVESLQASNWKLSKCIPPDNIPLDSWSRAVIPVKKRILSNQRGTAANQTGPGSVAKLPSESGRSKTRSVASKLRSVNTKHRDGTADSKNSRRPRGQLPDYIVKLPDEDASTQTSKTSNKQQSPTKHSGRTSAEQAERDKAIQEIEEKKRREEELEEKKRKLEEEEALRAATLEKELKGKEFTLTEDGEIIVIQAVNGDKLPAKHCKVEHVVMDSEEEEKQTEEEEVFIGAKHAQKKPAASKKQGKDSGENPFYRSAESFQQSILKNPALEVTAGVSIREGANGKSGPAIQESNKHMSRENFMLHQAMLESQYSVTVGATKPPSTKIGQVGASHLENVTSNPIAVAETTEPQEESTGKGGNTVESGDTSSPSTRQLDQGKKTDPLDARRSSTKTKRELQQGKPKQPPKQEHGVAPLDFDSDIEEEGMVNDHNLDLLNSPVWGQNRPTKDFTPKVLPGGTKASPTGGKKDRSRFAGEGKHLPAPLISPTLQPAEKHPVHSMEYNREFESLTQKGKIKMESDRALRLLGIPASRNSSFSRLSESGSSQQQDPQDIQVAEREEDDGCE